MRRVRTEAHESSKRKQKAHLRATGGPVLPGMTYLVGEQGPEMLLMGANGGFVVPSANPNGDGGGGSGNGSPVVIQLNLDGRVIAQIVDEHLYRTAKSAGTSTWSV